MTTRVVGALTCALATVVLPACDGPTPPECRATFLVTPGKLSLLVGSTARLEARAVTGDDRVIRPSSIRWSIPDTTVARVDSTGEVLGVAEGNAVAVARATFPMDAACVDRQTQAAARLTVTCAEGATIRSIQIDPADTTLVVGDTADFTYRLPSRCHLGGITERDTAVSWSTSDTSVAVVLDSLGRVRAVGEGAATVTATLETDPAKSASARLEVIPE